METTLNYKELKESMKKGPVEEKTINYNDLRAEYNTKRLASRSSEYKQRAVNSKLNKHRKTLKGL